MPGPTRILSKAVLEPIAHRFWSKVQKTDTCWLWTGAKTNGYGYFSVNGKGFRAHRVAYVLATSDETSLFLCHKCDVPGCVNPGHLFPGTQTDNMHDAALKGRMSGLNKKPRRASGGWTPGLPKLTPEQQRSILTELGSNVQVGKKYGVSRETIRRVRKFFGVQTSTLSTI